MDGSEQLGHVSQTQMGQFSSRLSNNEEQGYHKSLRNDNDFFRLVIESLEDYAVFTTDTEGIISSWNTGAEQVLGYNEQEIIGKDIAILFTEEDVKNRQPQVERENALRQGRGQDERQHVKRDGSLFWASGLMFPLVDEQQQLRGFTKILRDMSEQKLVQQRLADAQAYTESIVETIREPLLVLGKDLSVISANRSFYRTFQVSPQETLHHYVYKLSDGQWNIPELRILLEDILPNDSSFEDYRVEHTFPEMGERIMLLNARKLYREANHTEMILLAFTDVTERIQLERLKESFLRIASHELKTPITSVKGYVQLLLRSFRKQGNDEPAVNMLTKAERQLDRLTGLVNDLLDLSRLQTGKFTIHEETFDLTQLVQEVVGDVQTTTTSHRLAFENAEPILAYGDRDRIEQVLVNLMINAIKYSPQADKVLIWLMKNASSVVVNVQDLGQGIDAAHLQKVFDQFYQVETTSPEAKTGLGLGLYISNEIVKAHNGQMNVQSIVGQGSTFSFTLPLS